MFGSTIFLVECLRKRVQVLRVYIIVYDLTFNISISANIPIYKHIR